MAWIESHQEIRLHPKVRRLATLLEIELSQAIGHLHCLWWWVLDYAPDGDLGQFQDGEIAAACEWRGDAHRLVEALAACRFLDGDPGRLAIHDWQQYGGRYVQKRSDDKERQRRWRERRNVKEPVTRESRVSHDGVTRESGASHDATNQTNQPDQPDQPTDVHGSAAQAPPAQSLAVVSDAVPFDAFWDLYPKATEKRRARTTWARLSRDHRLAAMAGARVVAGAVTSGEVSVQFVPGAAVFLHGQRWGEWQDGIPAHYRPLPSSSGDSGRGALTASEIYRLTREESR